MRQIARSSPAYIQRKQMFQSLAKTFGGRDCNWCYMAPDNKMSQSVASNYQEFWMNYFAHAIAVTGLVAGFAFPAFAASHKMDATMMTCADFSAMDADGQMKAMEVMAMASEGMTSDQMASDEASSDAMASDDASSDDAMASDDMVADAMMATAKTCVANPDMMAMDAMMADKG